MATFHEWLNAETAKALASEEGKAFVAAGFEFTHTGGGCTAWEKQFADGRRIMITDSEGLGHTLGPSDANDPSKPDHWMIGFYLNEEDDSGTIMEAPTHGEAVAAALAFLFRHHVRAYFAADKLEEIDRINRANNDSTCATGDFSDSNMFMGEAFEELFGRVTDVSSQTETDMWNAAWNKAKAFGFGDPVNGADRNA